VGGKGKEAFEGCERVRGGCGLSKTTVLWSHYYVILGVEISIFNKSLCTLFATLHKFPYQSFLDCRIVHCEMLAKSSLESDW